MQALATAMTAGDDDGIRAVLRPDADLVIDAGGAQPAMPVPPGAARSSERRDEAVVGLRALMADDVAIMAASVNGMPGLALMREGTVVGVVTAQSRGRLLANVWVVSNPDKLRHWNR